MFLRRHFINLLELGGGYHVTVTRKANNISYNSYSDKYSDAGFWNKLSKCATKMGSKLVYNVLVLYYVMMSPGVPLHIKLAIVGALAYVIVPVDLIPDFIPVAGYSDDMAAIVSAVGMVADLITPDIKRKAMDKVRDIFGSTDDCTLAA